MAKKKNKTLKKSTYLVWLSMIGFLSSCSHFSLRSKESMDAEEKKPWNKDERTVDGAFNKSKQRLTPHIGFNLPIDNGPDLVKIPINKKPEEIKTEAEHPPKANGSKPSFEMPPNKCFACPGESVPPRV